jgi:hypothetical protein
MGDNTKRFIFSWWIWFGLIFYNGFHFLPLLLPFLLPIFFNPIDKAAGRNNTAS